MENLDTEVDSLLKSSLASNTWKTYNSAVDSFKRFRLSYNLHDVWPAPLYDIIKYIAYLSHTGISASTATTYVSGLSHFHKLYNLEDNTKSFFVSKLLEGFKRKNPKQLDLRMPISLNILQRVIGSLSHICQSNYEARLFASAFSLAFFGLLRVGELTAETKSEPGLHVIRINDISIYNNAGVDELHLKICSSKTDQLHKSATLVIRQHANSCVCPINLLKLYLQVRQRVGESQLYIHFDESPLTRYQFSSVLQKSLLFCEIPGHFRPHSFRIGGATEAKRLGIADDVIKRWGRWSSNVYLGYIRLKF